jgi:glycosyltransferase involved in cell wall biosynthesis
VPLATIKKWHEEGVVTYFGETDDVREFVLEADCVVLPTFYREGVPRSLIEAAAMGRPLIATDIAGCREIVVDNKNGYLCAPRDANDLARKMQQFVETEKKSKEQMGAFSRTLVENAFDEKLVIKKYLNQLAAHNGHGSKS